MTESQEVPGRKRRSGEEIKRLVLEFEASRLRQNEFCRNHGLALSTLHRQLKRRRLDKGDAKESGGFVAVELAGREPNGNGRSSVSVRAYRPTGIWRARFGAYLKRRILDPSIFIFLDTTPFPRASWEERG